MTINRTKDRIKQTGEVFTPLTLVDEILSNLPEETWQHEKTYLDPACGDGNFLVRVVAWKIWKGATPVQALQTTYGVELMSDNTSHARQRVLTHAFVADIYTSNTSDILPHLTYEEERSIGLKKTHDIFCVEHDHIVTSNIVNHNSLTYCYRFGKTSLQPRKDSIGVCECPLCNVDVDPPESTQLSGIISSID